MAHTVIGVFDSASQAQTAVSQLIIAGFSRDRVDLSTRVGDYSTNSHDDDNHDSGIGRLFRSLFSSSDNDDANRYSKEKSQGSLVTVHAQSAGEAERAVAIMDDFGALDVNEQAAA